MEKNKIPQKLFGLLSILILCTTLISCASTPNLPISSSPSAIPNNITAGIVSGSFITYTSLAKLVSESTLIVMAQIIKPDHIINMARDVKDPTQPAKDDYVVGQVYQVKINRFIKGTADETIYVVQSEGFLGPTESKSESEILKSKSRYDYIPMTQEKEYLLFLQSMLSYPEEKLYVGNAQPWRFDISDSSKVVPESPWKYAIEYFPPQPLDAFLEQIAHPEKIVANPTSSYPPPQQSPSSMSAYPAPQKPKP
jgi:hypothetical protein